MREETGGRKPGGRPRPRGHALRWWGTGGAWRGLACLFPLLAALAVGRAEIVRVKVRPGDTDPAIGAAYNQPHTAYVDRDILVGRTAGRPAARGELLVFLPGTNGSGDRGGEGLCELAAKLGYVAVGLTYPTGISAAEVCAADPDPRAFEAFRLALIEGGRWRDMLVSRADSIENRLEKLLTHLHRLRPDEGWGGFLTDGGELRWERMAVAGHSQGGGHAVLIGLRHRVVRVVATGAPKDFSRRLDAPAAWYKLPSATPKSAFFTFNHVADRQGCTWTQQGRNLAALGLAAFGPEVDVTAVPPPFRHTRTLVTTFPATTESKVAHTSVIATSAASRLAPVWTYLLTERVETGR